MGRLVALLERTELNALVIDIRSNGAPLLCASDEETRAILQDLHSRDIYAIARAVAFKGGPHGWYDPGSQARWRELAEISSKAGELGFDEINYDYVRYGAVNEPKSRTPVEERAPTLRAFFGFLRQQVGAHPISADVFGATLLAPQLHIGQRLADAVEHFDYVMPMPYPSHWGTGSFGLANPAHHPYETLHESLSRGWRSVAELPTRVGTVRSWIQAFNLDSSRPMRRYEYTPWHIREQIRACDDSGCSGWALWNALNLYDESAFAPHGGGEA